MTCFSSSEYGAVLCRDKKHSTRLMFLVFFFESHSERRLDISRRV